MKESGKKKNPPAYCINNYYNLVQRICLLLKDAEYRARPHHAHLFRQTKIGNILDSLGGLWSATSCGLVCVLMYVMLDW